MAMRCGFIVLFLAGFTGSYAQSQYVVDSLKNAVTRAKTDSARVRALTELAVVYGTFDYTAALAYCDSASMVASGPGKERKKLLCYVRCRHACIYRLGNDSTQYRKAILAAEQLAVELKDSVLFGLAYHEQAMYSNFRLLKYEDALRLFLKSSDLLEHSGYHKTLHLNHTNTGVIFQRIGDYNKNLFYAKKSLKHAKNVNDLAYSYHYIGTAYINIGFRGPEFEFGIDSGLFFLKKARHLVAIHRKRIKDLFLISAITSIIARTYVNHNLKYVYNMDSAVFYLEESRKDAHESGNRLDYTTACTILSKYYLDANNIKRAEYLLNEARNAYYYTNVKFRNEAYSVKSDMYLGLSFLAEKKGLYSDAIANFKRYYAIRDTMYNVQKLNSIRSIESEFMIDKKDRQVKALEEQDYNRKKRIYFYFALAAAGLMLFIFLYRLNVFRRKFFTEQEKALEQQAKYALLKKEEAERALQLEIEDSKKLDFERKRDVNQKEQYQKELMASVLHLERKNDLLLRLKESIISFDENADERKKVQKLIDENLELDNDFDRFSKNFELVYPDFFNRLKERSAGNLTKLDLRYSAYIHMGLSATEISNLLNIDPASIRKARYRLKQKLGLGKEDDLNNFINNELLGINDLPHSFNRLS